MRITPAPFVRDMEWGRPVESWDFAAVDFESVCDLKFEELPAAASMAELLRFRCRLRCGARAAESRRD